MLELRRLEPTDGAFAGMSMSVCDCLLWGVHRKGESHIHTGAIKFLYTVCPCTVWAKTPTLCSLCNAGDQATVLHSYTVPGETEVRVRVSLRAKE